MSEELKVLLNDEQVGVLTRDKKRHSARFSYLNRNCTPISVALPSERDTFDSLATKNWFEGLLPEGDQRRHLEKHFKVEQGDYFALLKEIGWECAGAISVVPMGYTTSQRRYQPVTEFDISSRLANLPRTTEIPDEEMRLSLGGYQAKMLVAQIEGNWYIPFNGAPSTHILKPSTDKEPFIADAEAWALHIAGSVTDVPVSTLQEFAGIRCMVSKRYDRLPQEDEGSNDWFQRVHQEDFAQAMLIHPDNKYAENTKPTSPSFSRMAQILVEHSNEPDIELERLLRQNVVNVMIGNLDNHSKNYGLLHNADGSVSLAPQYDVVTAKHYTPNVKNMGMAINGKFTWGRIGRDDLIEDGRKSLGLPSKTAKNVVDTAINDFVGAMTEANAMYPQCPLEIRDSVEVYAQRFVDELESASKLSMHIPAPIKNTKVDTGRCMGVVKSRDNAPCVLISNHGGPCRSVK